MTSNLTAPDRLPPEFELPAPADPHCLPVFAALALRKTIREFRETALPAQLLANVLWAAGGVNRAAGPAAPFGVSGRTAASASNSQEIELYVAAAQGAYRYDALAHRMVPVVARDLRGLALTPGQRGVRPSAPITLIFVADLRRLTHTAGFDEPGLHDPQVQDAYCCVDTGLMAGNVHVYAASRGLAAWFHNCNRKALACELRLVDPQRVLFAQSVGYPAQG